MKTSRKFALGEGTPVNPALRSGCFTLDGDSEDDGTLGLKPFVSLWTGLATLEDIATRLPPASIIVSFYHQDMMPYNWS